MSIIDQKRLPPEVFKLDAERMRRGWYSDHYFNNTTLILSTLAAQDYRFEGQCPDLSAQGVEVANIDVGNIEVDMQYFTRREPFSIVAGVDHALAILKLGTGYVDDRGEFINTYDQLEIDAVHDGDKVMPWEPVLRVRGRYRDFAVLETPTLGALARRTRIATNVYQTLRAANGKPILFFPARFDIHEAQPGDGYAYRIAVEVWNREQHDNLGMFISTEAQGDWWGEKGGGTVAHAYLLCFLRDTAEAMLQFAKVIPADVNRVVLVDVNNDCVDDSVKTATAMFQRYRELIDAGQPDEASRYVLFGVRPDTSGNMIDQSVVPLGDAKLDCGVNPRLVYNLRQALDGLADRLELPSDWQDRARQYFRQIQIVATGGFNPQRIAQFEAMGVPVNIYGVGSYLFEGENNDFTADVVRVKIEGQWYDMAKVGRQARHNPHMQRVVY
ncbi:MAG: nicotinate phosphoribosyltransferase [Candidatus Entotheonella factor]|uniref:Nicotinate phosphoribosyltransferase n=1 Tax=Entotheonella factor TaxID=1429438 RepID=W4LY02_ENTF1|nr:MAG: nicotinate phosphoribosyltransferase [Candidatus Entotheonella factor]